MRTIRLETRTSAPPAACFALSLSVDAHSASLNHTDERAVAGVTTGEIRAGETVTWRARHFGLRWRMTSRIADYDAPRRFVDEQIAGPFAHWWHEHRFEETDDGTLMVDTVEFAAPFGVLGRLAERVFLERYMTRLLQRRNDWLAGELETAGAA